MTATITYFYALGSGFAYLGEPRLRQVAADAGARILYRPMAIGEVFAASGTTAPARQSATRLAYRRADLARWARRLGLPLNPVPAFWPVDDALAARAVVALQDMGGDAGALSFALLGDVWARDRDISRPEVVADALARVGTPADAVLAEARSERVAGLYAANTARAVELGVFGSPSYVVDQEIYWGQDRLDFVAATLAGEDAA